MNGRIFAKLNAKERAALAEALTDLNENGPITYDAITVAFASDKAIRQLLALCRDGNNVNTCPCAHCQSLNSAVNLLRRTNAW